MDGGAGKDEWLFGWDPTPGVVSVWADRAGRALVWRRVEGRVVCERERYRPWLFAASTSDLEHLGSQLRPEPDDPSAPAAPFSWRRLAGEGAYPYLLTARDGRALERAVCAGAARQLGRPVSGLDDLEGYYRVGPVEQYLMATGRAYFRGLGFGEVRRLQLDLETTALKPSEGRIFMAAVRDSSGFEAVLEASRGGDNEAALLRDLCALVKERDPDVIENHNLFGFDLPFLEARAAALGVPLTLGRLPGPLGLARAGNRRTQRYSLAGRELLDTLDATLRHDFVARDMPSHGLKDVARYFGVASPERTYLSGRSVAEIYARNPALVRRYALDDVREVDAVSKRLHAPAFALSGMAPRRLERLAHAGTATGVLEPMLVRAYLRAGRALPASSEPPSGEPHAGGSLVLFETGVAERVVKADVASLYPSIIRVHHIGPSCDTLGVFVHLVDRLTALRLAHKAAAREAAPGSLEAGHHGAVQAAMKLVVNSAYGYLGAGRLALFADRRAADEVTRRGREVLGAVCRGLRERGATLIEADTDGVYFAAPEGWGEAKERAVVAEVGSLLPPGLALEFEGRYQAMFSHEVKNYALLGHDGTLTVRGGALRSSRAEPFGERFLEAALRCLLEGEVLGARRAFLEAAASLRAGRLAAADVAPRVRLTKTPRQYRQSRSRRAEAAYEALLAAGREDWVPGEKVRVYRARGGCFVWLPDGEAGRRDYDAEHYVALLRRCFAERLRKAFCGEDFERLFRLEGQDGLFDQPLEAIRLRRVAPG